MRFCFAPHRDRNRAIGDALDLQREQEARAAITAAEAVKVLAGDVEATGCVVAGEAGAVDPAGEGRLLFPRAAATARLRATHRDYFYRSRVPSSTKRAHRMRSPCLDALIVYAV